MRIAMHALGILGVVLALGMATPATQADNLTFGIGGTVRQQLDNVQQSYMPQGQNAAPSQRSFLPQRMGQMPQSIVQQVALAATLYPFGSNPPTPAAQGLFPINSALFPIAPSIQQLPMGTPTHSTRNIGLIGRW